MFHWSIYSNNVAFVYASAEVFTVIKREMLSKQDAIKQLKESIDKRLVPSDVVH